MLVPHSLLFSCCGDTPPTEALTCSVLSSGKLRRLPPPVVSSGTRIPVIDVCFVKLQGGL